MKNLRMLAFVLCTALLPVTVNAADKDNYLGLGIGYVAAGIGDSAGYAFMFQMQQSPTSALGIAYHEGENIVGSYKMYTGAYGNSLFWEGGVIYNSYADAVLPAIAAGTDIKFSDTTMVSLTIGTGFGGGGTAFVARGAFMFKL